MERQIIYLIMLAMSTSVISLTLSKAKVFTPFRDWLKSLSPDYITFSFLYKMVSCPYCLSFYPSIIFAVFCIKDLDMIVHASLFNLVILWFTIVGLASMFTGLIYLAISQIGGDDE